MANVPYNVKRAGRDDLRVLDMMRRRPIMLTGTENNFSGTAYVAGVKVENLNTYPERPWVKVDLANATATEEASAPPDPFPEDQEWYEKAYTYGDIHESRS